MEGSLRTRGRRLWVEAFEEVVLLKEVMRQGDDAAFCHLLNAMRDGDVTDEQMMMLKAREVGVCNGASVEGGEAEHTMHVAATWKVASGACDSHFLSLPHGYETLAAKDKVVLPLDNQARARAITADYDVADVNKLREKAKNPSVEGVRKYPHQIRVYPGSRVVLTDNIRGGKLVYAGLFNGAQGTVRGIVKDITGEVVVVLVEFDDLRIKSGLTHTGRRVVPIIRQTTTISLQGKLNGIRIQRSAFPLREGYGLTLHKAQGMSVDRCCVHFHAMESVGGSWSMPYVGCSRVRTMQGLCVVGVPYSAYEMNKKYGIKSNPTMVQEEERLNTRAQESNARWRQRKRDAKKNGDRRQ